MIQEITYGGYTANPSDYESADGQLAASLNLINEDGSLAPIFQPKQLFQLSQGCRLLCVHKTANYTHYIIQTVTNSLSWQDDSGNGGLISNSIVRNITDSSCIGNTVIINTQDSVVYFLWSTNESGVSSYTKLSPKIPEVKLSFGLQASYADSIYTNNDILDRSDFDVTHKLITNKNKEFSQFVVGCLSEFIDKSITEHGCFCYPFFVRYAFRLYDGSTTMASAPILMIPSNDGKPFVDMNINDSQLYCNLSGITVRSMKHKLDYACVTNASGISPYSDIVKTIDIYVSPQIYGYEDDMYITSGVASTNFSQFGIYKYPSDSSGLYRKQGSPLSSTSGYIVDIPNRKKSSVYSDIQNVSNFYLVKSIPIGEISSTRKVVDIEPYKLRSLYSMEVLQDDYDSHDTLLATYSHEYNSRVMLYGVKKSLFGGYFNQYFANALPTGETGDCFVVSKVFTTIKRDGRVIVVKETVNESFSIVSAKAGTTPALFIPYFYYPDSNATKAEIYGTVSGQTYKLTLKLNPHDMLNGSFYFDNFIMQQLVAVDSIDATESTDRTITLSNKVYVSEVNNPFFFPAQSIVSVGSGIVNGIASAAQALSQGQFGSFPLYAFSTDGVWAISVNDNGVFYAVQPIARDVCINHNSIAQLDGSVMFATDRGLMIVSGSKVECVSDPIFSEYPFDVLSLPNAGELHGLMGHTDGSCLPVRPFLEYLRNCRIVYDYLHQRIIVFNPSIDNAGNPTYTYCYVLSLKSGQWGMLTASIHSTVNSYPDAIVMTHDRRVVTFSQTSELVSHGLFVTRPIKFGKAGIFKSVHTVLQRGYFQNTADNREVCTVLYASRDLYHWFLIGSSVGPTLRLLHGTPYKYFRIAGVTHLTQGETLSGATIDVIPRELTNIH